MRKASKQLSPEALNLIALRFRVLGEPSRLRILNLLRHGEMNVSEITELLDSTQPNVSKHLRILQDAGLIARRQEGGSAFYSIADNTVFALCDVVCASMRERLEGQAGLFKATSAGTRTRRSA